MINNDSKRFKVSLLTMGFSKAQIGQLYVFVLKEYEDINEAIVDIYLRVDRWGVSGCIRSTRNWLYKEAVPSFTSKVQKYKRAKARELSRKLCDF